MNATSPATANTSDTLADSARRRAVTLPELVAVMLPYEQAIIMHRLANPTPDASRQILAVLSDAFERHLE